MSLGGKGFKQVGAGDNPNDCLACGVQDRNLSPSAADHFLLQLFDRGVGGDGDFPGFH